MLVGMASLLIDLGGWDIWGRAALTQALLFGAATLAFAGVGARRAARKRGRLGSGDAFMAAGIIAAVALCALVANVWLDYAIEDQRVIKGGLVLICACACGVYWLAVGMFGLRGAGGSGRYVRRDAMGDWGERCDSVGRRGQSGVGLWRGIRRYGGAGVYDVHYWI